MRFESMLQKWVDEEHSSGRIKNLTESQSIIMSGGSVDLHRWKILMAELFSNYRFFDFISEHREEYQEFIDKKFLIEPLTEVDSENNHLDFGSFYNLKSGVKKIPVLDIEIAISKALQDVTGVENIIVEVKGQEFGSTADSVEFLIGCQKDFTPF